MRFRKAFIALMLIFNHLLPAAVWSEQSFSVAGSAEDVTSLGVGQSVPNVSLRAASGKPVELHSLLEEQGAVLIFYRGGWCPYCNVHLGELAKNSAEFEKIGLPILAISPDSPATIRKNQKKREAPYEHYSDSSMEVSRAFGLAFQLDPVTVKLYKDKYSIDIERDSGETHHQLPVPAAFVVSKEGKILFTHSNPDYKTRIDPAQLLVAAQAAIRSN